MLKEDCWPVPIDFFQVHRRARLPATRREAPGAAEGDLVTTHVKRACAFLALLAGAAALTGSARCSGDRPAGAKIDGGFVSNHGEHDEALEALADSAEPFLPEQAQPHALPPARAAGASDFWTFSPARDTFRADALLDLRKLNETTAGQSGFLRLSADKNSFVRGDGEPIRFWAVNFDPAIGSSAAEMPHLARFLAKRGVNLVRLMYNIGPPANNSRVTDVNSNAVDHIWRLVAAAKKEGIYTLISPYWSEQVKKVPANWQIDGWPENQPPLGLLFFNPTLQTAYRAWLKALLARKNPYTGIPLSEDPAVAFIQLQNEDSLLFWSAQLIKGRQLELMGKQFGDWAAAKYGTIEAALGQWNGGAMKEDDPSRGILGIQILWHLTQPPGGALKNRLTDQLQFLAETMHRFNAETARYLHEELNCKQLINAGNWMTANSIRLNDAERWSYTANEVIGVNRYYDTVHLGPDAAWRINKGDRFQNESVLLNPRAFPLSIKQVQGYPVFVTETNWTHPLGYQSEAPFLTAVYQSLSGVDAAFWVSARAREWSNSDRTPAVPDSQYKWIISTPTLLGQFPAAALLFRRGDVARGEPVVIEHRSTQEIWERVPPIIAEDKKYDPKRDLAERSSQPNRASAVDPLAFLVGPVETVYGSDPAKTIVADPSRLIDRERKVVRSNTGQITWDYGRGLCTLDAPRAQGATGFLKPVGPIKLSNVTIRSENAYASVLVVSLDDKPLAQSGQVLVQVGTRHRPTGWADHAVTFETKDKERIRGRQVDSTGKMPWVVQVTMAAVEVRNSNLKSATLLDMNGNARSKLPAKQQDGTIAVELPRDAMYVVLSSE
jgi:hypothetical protein